MQKAILRRLVGNSFAAQRNNKINHLLNVPPNKNNESNKLPILAVAISRRRNDNLNSLPRNYQSTAGTPPPPRHHLFYIFICSFTAHLTLVIILRFITGNFPPSFYFVKVLIEGALHHVSLLLHCPDNFSFPPAFPQQYLMKIKAGINSRNVVNAIHSTGKR
jgi:hypothetical protein